MSHKMLRPFIIKVSVLGYFPLPIFNSCEITFITRYNNIFSWNNI